jgi:hypothetical protein
MGFKHTWMATQEADEAAILDRLNLQVVAEADDYGAADYTLARLPTGWLIIVSNEEVEFHKLAPRAVPEGFALTGWMNETVMVSEARGFRDGVQEWAVVHDPDVDLQGVQIEGTPPAALAEIYRRLQSEQAKGHADVDYIFDAPVDLSKEICGFVHDQDMDTTWKVLASKGRAPKTEDKGFFARLFGR